MDNKSYKIDNNNLNTAILHIKQMKNIIKNMPIGLPVSGNYRLGSKFGIRIDPFIAEPAMHSGVDIYVEDNNILATHDGIVNFADHKGTYGNCIDIIHGDDYSTAITTRYAHLSKINVKKGQFVKKGDIIGIQGHSGRATGNHLHYEVLYKNTQINPIKFIEFKNQI
jgi:murein DD-endopeptidase MepM/ murein hydrolase activator NlpD